MRFASNRGFPSNILRRYRTSRRWRWLEVRKGTQESGTESADDPDGPIRGAPDDVGALGRLQHSCWRRDMREDPQQGLPAGDEGRGLNDLERNGYGACPPIGRHRTFIKCRVTSVLHELGQPTKRTAHGAN